MRKEIIERNNRELEFKTVLFDLLLKMNYARFTGDLPAYFALIEQLDILLTPFHDELYRKDLEIIEQEFNGKVEAKTPAEAMAKHNGRLKAKMEAKLRALMKLAYRVGVIPIKSIPGKGGNL